MITPSEIDTFQRCRALWKLSRENGLPFEEENDYLSALRKTIFQMYSWLQEKDRFMTDRQVRERWDKNWWAAATEENILQKETILNLATNGWMVLEDYWNNKYLAEPKLIPIGINFEFSVYCQNVHYRIHTDLVLSDKDGRFYYRQFGNRKNEWQIYNNLSTKLEIFGLTEVLGCPPAKKSHIDLLSKKTKISEKTLTTTPAYLHSCISTINSISMAVKNNAIYTSPSDSCTTCPFSGKCWL